MSTTVDLTERQTVKNFKIDGSYTPERKEMHTILVSEKVKGVPSSENPECILFAGGSGAGKSTYLNELFKDLLETAVVIDADEIKEDIPEYKTFLADEQTQQSAAFLVHTESADIADQLIKQCIELHLSFAYVGTMSYEPAYLELIPLLKESSYLITGLYIDVDLEVSKSRVQKRFIESKRFVPEDVVERSNINSAIVFLNLKQYFDTVLMFNNTEKLDSTKPFYKRTSAFTGNFLGGTILNYEHLILFIAKATL